MSKEFLVFPRYQKQSKAWLGFLIVMLIASIVYLVVSIVSLWLLIPELDGVFERTAEICAALASIAISLASSIYGAKSNKKLRDYLEDITRKNQPIRHRLKPYTPQKEKPLHGLTSTQYVIQGLIILLFFGISVLKVWNLVYPIAKVSLVINILSVISTISIILLSALSIWSVARSNYNTAILIKEIAHQDDCLFELYNSNSPVK